jgi:hypothetical protein
MRWDRPRYRSVTAEAGRQCRYVRARSESEVCLRLQSRLVRICRLLLKAVW